MGRRASSKVIYDRLYRAILKYGQAEVIIERIGNKEEYGQRIIRRTGHCKVSYGYSNSYKKKYQLSCFYEDSIEWTGCGCSCCVQHNKKAGRIGKRKGSLARTLRFMKDHDGRYLRIKSIRAGKKEIPLGV